MKQKFILYIASMLISATAFAQAVEDCTISKFVVAGKYNFQIIGDDASPFVDALVAHYPDSKRKGYFWKFKNIEIPGIDKPLTFEVRQGLFGEEVYDESDGTKCQNGFYFATFTSEACKQDRIANRKPTEQDAISIHVKNGRNYGLSSQEEAEIVRQFLLSLYRS